MQNSQHFDLDLKLCEDTFVLFVTLGLIKKENRKLLAQAKLHRIGLLAPNLRQKILQEINGNNEKFRQRGKLCLYQGVSSKLLLIF